MTPPAVPKPSAAALSPFGKNSQNAATLGKGTPISSESSKQGPSTPKGSKTPGKGGGSGNRSISLSSRSSPQPSRADSSSPLAGPSSSVFAPAVGPTHDASGLLSRDQETTYHRQFRVALQALLSAARKWEEIATFDGLKWAKEATDSWSDIYAARELSQSRDDPGPKVRSASKLSALKEEQKRIARSLDCKQAQNSRTGPGGLQETRIGAALQRIETAEDMLSGVIDKFARSLAKLRQAAETLRTLLVEATVKRGLDFAFQEPLWGTWPMARFVEKASDLIPQYDLSTSHLQLLLPILLRSGEPKVAQGLAAKKSSSSGEGKAAVDPNSIRRQAYEEWIALPYLDTQGSDSLAWFESLCEVEVGRWRE